MENKKLFNAATLIVEHNRSPNLIQAWATWDDAAGVLSLTYLTAEAHLTMTKNGTNYPWRNCLASSATLLLPTQAAFLLEHGPAAKRAT